MFRQLSTSLSISLLADLPADEGLAIPPPRSGHTDGPSAAKASGAHSTKFHPPKASLPHVWKASLEVSDVPQSGVPVAAEPKIRSSKNRSC